MKYILFAGLICIGMAAQAGNCAGNMNEVGNIQGLLGKINPFGTWAGVQDGKKITAEFTKLPSGSFSGKLDFGDSVFGPTGVKMCEYTDAYSVIVYFYEAELKVLSSKKITLVLPTKGNPVVTLTKIK